MNASKLRCMFITTPQKRRNHLQYPIKYGDTTVEYVEICKYLGVILDHNLNWKAQINSVLNRINMVTDKFRCAIRERWGLRSHVMKLLYHAVFVPIMMYACTIWGHGVTKGFESLFIKAQRRYCLMAMRCLRTAASDLIFGFMSTAPFPILLKQEVAKVSLTQLFIRPQPQRNNQRRRLYGSNVLV